MKSAGYTWQKEPTDEQPGEGLILPDGTPLPAILLLAPFETADPQRAAAAQFVEQFLSYIGTPLVAKFASPEDIRYAVYSSGGYDMAIIGWGVSAYPGYLCEWFQPPSPFAYGAGRLESACQALKAAINLETARQSVIEIQSILMEDLPFIPLYQGMIYEAYRNINYPFEHVLDGLSGLYGAPSLAIPSP
ncbi:MAG: hypothetical protein A2Z03_00300 [Chloroflexi bacterium RBG_16_56_8]|nr:MAG: hypothetical protein A2Z03_00300 [Chloroflexi bacterium RBG_16_56_8]